MYCFSVLPPVFLWVQQSLNMLSLQGGSITTLGGCVRTPRESGRGPKNDIGRFREKLTDWEKGGYFRGVYPPSGDLGADGFIMVGRICVGPVFVYQAKNSYFDIGVIPEGYQQAHCLP